MINVTAYGSHVFSSAPATAVNGDKTSGVAAEAASAPTLFGDMNISAARTVTIRVDTNIDTPRPFYEVQFKLPCNYNGSEDCSHWGSWIAVTSDVFVQDAIAVKDIRFRNVESSALPLYVDIGA